MSEDIGKKNEQRTYCAEITNPWYNIPNFPQNMLLCTSAVWKLLYITRQLFIKETAFKEWIYHYLIISSRLFDINDSYQGFMNKWHFKEILYTSIHSATKL